MCQGGQGQALLDSQGLRVCLPLTLASLSLCLFLSVSVSLCSSPPKISQTSCFPKAPSTLVLRLHHHTAPPPVGGG